MRSIKTRDFCPAVRRTRTDLRKFVRIMYGL
jgi:hypothetical protein